MNILNIGCGPNKYKTDNPDDIVIGLDMQKLPSVDVVWDLNKTPLPFKNGEFDMVYASHVVEHVKDVFQLFEEVHRILKIRGIFKIIAPHFSNPVAYSPDHKTYWGFHSIDFVEEGHSDHYLIKSNFKILSKKFKLFKFRQLCWFANKFPNFYETWISGFLRSVEITYELRAIK